MGFARALRHLATTAWAARRRFPAAALDAIEAAIREGERAHSGEVCFLVEAALEPGDLWRGTTARERAVSVFAEQGVWDTDANNGVLIYLLLAERDVEIVADRGAAAAIGAEVWERVCREMEAHFREERFAEGALAGVRGVNALLARHFPVSGERANPNELRDRPTVR
jgi:uncharacterized membrane protein